MTRPVDGDAGKRATFELVSNSRRSSKVRRLIVEKFQIRILQIELLSSVDSSVLPDVLHIGTVAP